jgi:FkbM family methyltransferase
MYYIPLNSISINEVLDTYFEQMESEDINMVIVGANNGELKDFLTPHLSRSNVSAVLVEPVAELFHELERRFAGAANLHFENSAIGRRTCRKTIYRVGKREGLPEWSRGLGSFSKEVILGHENQVAGLRKYVIPEKVSCITFSKLMEKHGLQVVNILQVDTEGHDHEIITSLDLNKVRPDVIIAEYMHMTFYQYFALITLLMDNNYRVSKSNESFDLVAVDEEIL